MANQIGKERFIIAEAILLFEKLLRLLEQAQEKEASNGQQIILDILFEKLLRLLEQAQEKEASNGQQIILDILSKLAFNQNELDKSRLVCIINRGYVENPFLEFKWRWKQM